MKTTISKVFDGEPRKVEFLCSAGGAIATWHGKSLPEKGKAYDSELDITETLALGTNCSKSDLRKFTLIRDDDSTTRVIGMVDSIDEDGMVYLRLADDCLIMIESSIGTFAESDWITLCINSDAFHITPQ